MREGRGRDYILDTRNDNEYKRGNALIIRSSMLSILRLSSPTRSFVASFLGEAQFESYRKL